MSRSNAPVRWTDIAVKSFKPRDMRYEVKCPGLPGLRLEIMPSGSRSFIFRFTHAGRYQRMTFGQYPQCSLATALDLYKDATAALMHGRSPIDEYKRRRHGEAVADDTVTAHIELYKTLHVATLASGTQAYIIADLDRLQGEVGAKAIRDVTAKDVQGVIDKAMKRGESARNTMYKVCKQFFTWACAPSRADCKNPTASIERPSDDRIRDRHLDDDEIKIVWKAAQSVGGPPGALVKLLLLTGCRRDEMCFLRRSEVRANSIELPGERTKNGVAHSIPLTWLMRRIIVGLPKGGKFVLTGQDQGLGGHTKARARIVTDDIEHWTFHDLRRTFSTGLARLRVPLEVAEKCLNHISGVSRDPLVLTYNKHQHKDEITEAFGKWTDHVAALVGEQPDQAAAA